MSRNLVLFVALTLAFEGLVLLPACRHYKYQDPITKDIRKPGTELSHFERARLMRNTLVNTYGAGENDLARAEAEYREFILFSPSQAADRGNYR